MDGQRVIGVDLGGTKILAGVLERDGTIGETCEVPTPTESQDELVEAIADAVEQVREPGTAALGLGIPSVLDAAGRSLDSINIPLAGIALGGCPRRALRHSRRGRERRQRGGSRRVGSSAQVAGSTSS